MRVHPQLPIYFLSDLRVPILYTPGTLAVIDRADLDSITKAFNSEHIRYRPGFELAEPINLLLRHAEEAVARRSNWLSQPYKPECLTVYLSNQCNLQCVYCFAAGYRQQSRQPDATGLPLIKEDAFRAAAELVAGNCAQKKKPFHLVLHGGGEPTLHWELLQRLVRISKSVARQHDISWIGYLATNGMISRKKAEWLGKTFTRVGLSCDGPPDIQKRQRPGIDLEDSSERVKKTARILAQSSAHLTIRTTITPETIGRQKEIVEYLVSELGADILRFEPSYAMHPGRKNSFAVEDAGYYASCYMEALHAASRQGAHLSFSGVRLHEIHGPYCNLLRQVLHLMPDNKATACFLSVDGNDPLYSNLVIGRFVSEKNEFWMDHGTIAVLREKAGRIPMPCRSCFVSYHCVRSCPEVCHSRRQVKDVTSLFRCQLNRKIAQLFLEATVTKLIETEASPVSEQRSRSTNAIPGSMIEVLNHVDSGTREDVIEKWRIVTQNYDIGDRGLPEPLWAHTGFQYDGQQTWDKISYVLQGTSGTDPMSLYVHIPFCDKRCLFCDCHSIAGPQNHHLQNIYSKLLLRDICSWGKIANLASRPVTTIHFGGGSPLSLNSVQFDCLTGALAETFNITNDTEWAVEATAISLTKERLHKLTSLGFQRVHIGVQTLDDHMRKIIGRQSNANSVLKSISKCLDVGMITTVDLMFGLPKESAQDFVSTISILLEQGVHGFSFYRFNHSRRNNSFVRQYQQDFRDIYHDYAMFMVADQMMIKAGLQKNHFAHYSSLEDKNLYYTHTRRQEDLLAIGASADGVFKGLHYRYPELSGKYFYHQADIPLLQGGVEETASDKKISRITAYLMTGRIPKKIIDAFELGALFDSWHRSGLLLPCHESASEFSLTGNGSWLIRKMLNEIARYFSS